MYRQAANAHLCLFAIIPIMPAPSIALSLHTPTEVQALWATRLRELRLRAGWRQLTLAERAGVSLATVRRFEKDGQTTLANLLRLCHALGVLDQCAGLFAAPAVSSMQDLRKAAVAPARRGRR